MHDLLSKRREIERSEIERRERFTFSPLSAKALENPLWHMSAVEFVRTFSVFTAELFFSKSDHYEIWNISILRSPIDCRLVFFF